MKAIILFLLASPVWAQEKPWILYENSSLTKMTVIKKNHSSLLNKTTEVEGELFLSKGKLQLKTKENLVIVKGEDLTVVSFLEDKNQVLKGKLEKDGLLRDLSSLDFKKCSEDKDLLKCKDTSFLFKNKKLEKIEYIDEIDNKTTIEIKETVFNSKDKVLFEYKPLKKDEIQDLNSL